MSRFLPLFHALAPSLSLLALLGPLAVAPVAPGSSVASQASGRVDPARGTSPQGGGSRPASKPGGPGSNSPLEAIDEIERKLTRALFERRPWLPRERGLDRFERGLGRYGTSSTTWWSALLESSNAELDSLRPQQISPGRRTDLEWLRSWTRAELILTYYRSPERWDPLTYVERAERVLRSLIETNSADRTERAMQVLSVLKDLPALWEAAERSLVSPGNVFTEEALGRLTDLAEYIRNDLPRIARGLPMPPPVRERFDKVQRTALTHTIGLRNWLSQRPIETLSPISFMGAENWEGVVRPLSGVNASPKELKTLLLRDLAQWDGQLGEYRNRKAMPPRELQPKKIADLVLEGARTGVTLATLVGAFEHIDVKPHKLTPVILEGASQPRPLTNLVVGRFGTTRLEIELMNDAWPSTLRLQRAMYLNRDAQKVMGLRYAVPGTSFLFERARASEVHSRRSLWNRPVMDGWGLFALDWLVALDWIDNPLIGDKALRAEIARAKIIEISRLLATLEVHAETLSELEIRQNFQRRAHCDAASARVEVRLAMHDPLHGIGYLGYRELTRLSEALVEKHGHRRGRIVMLELVAEYPSARPTDLLQWVVQPGSDR